MKIRKLVDISSDQEVRCTRSNCHLKLGKWKEALEDAEAVLAEYKVNSNFFINTGVCQEPLSCKGCVLQIRSFVQYVQLWVCTAGLSQGESPCARLGVLQARPHQVQEDHQQQPHPRHIQDLRPGGGTAGGIPQHLQHEDIICKSGHK